MRVCAVTTLGTLAALALGCSGAGAGADGAGTAAGLSDPEPTASASAAVSSTSIASLALANVGKGACSTTSLGGQDFESSCTGNGGLPEYWCADFALWVWANAGVSDVGGLSAAAGSFYVYGQNHGTLSDTPQVGDAVVFDYQGGGYADHVAIVTQIESNGDIETVSGDWNGDSGSEATFASTSKVVLNSPAYAPTVGSAPSIMGMTISGFVAPVGLTQGYGGKFVSQSFPLATTALEMTAGETVAAYIEMKNVGGETWDDKTRIGTTQPRDRTSAFADSTWIAPDRPAGVKGTVAPGGTYKFTFDLHAPDEPGTYFEYFGMVEEGVAWFSDPGQGGPPDDDLEVQIVVEAAPDAGAQADAGSHHGDAGAEDDGGAATADDDAGASPSVPGDPASGDDAGAAGDDAGSAAGNGASAGSAGSSGGCSVTARSAGSTGSLAPLAGLLGLAAMAEARRRRVSARRSA